MKTPIWYLNDRKVPVETVALLICDLDMGDLTKFSFDRIMYIIDTIRQDIPLRYYVDLPNHRGRAWWNLQKRKTLRRYQKPECHGYVDDPKNPNCSNCRALKTCMAIRVKETPSWQAP